MGYDVYNVSLITPLRIKELCPEIPDTIDDALMTSCILDIQESHLQNLLGYCLYQNILIQYSSSTFTTPNQYIFDRFIERIIAKAVIAKSIYLISYQFENSGVIKKFSDQSNPLDKEELNSLKQLYLNDVDRLSKDLVYHMNTNISDYHNFMNTQYWVPSGPHERSMYSALNIMGF